MARKPEQSSIRAGLKRELGDDIHVAMARSLKEALDSMKMEWIACQHCAKMTPLAVPHAFERAKACQTVIEQLEGKVGTHRDAPAAAKVDVSDLDELSDDQLVALLEQSSDEDDEMESDDDAD